jgi:type IV secretory pathway VirB10-like protein
MSDAPAKPDPVLQAMKNDRTGCIAAILFGAVLVATCAGGFVGNDPDTPTSARTREFEDTALGILPALKTTNTAPAPTTAPTTAPPVPVTEAPQVAAPQQQGQQGQGQQAPQTPQQPAAPQPPVEVCAVSGSASVSGGSGGLSSSGGSYTASGPSSVTVSGYPTCHSPRYGIRLQSPTAFATGCFLDNFVVNVQSLAGETVNVTIKLGC